MAPLLYIIYINDLDCSMSIDIKFADDTKVKSNNDARLFDGELDGLFECSST